ncbi:MAG: succinate dehydrogenase assembly factor 2 [Gammaproteobacteria bacterium]|nr:succinate dehydrogenase assembly factor 2 [Gammaproteobacteria bacterium]
MNPSPVDDLRLRWRCRRGMRELDVLLSSYLERTYPAASAEHRRAFAILLEQEDPQLWRWVLGVEPSPPGALGEVVAALRQPGAPAA